MKTKLFLILTLVYCTGISSFAQDTIAGWTFPTGTSADANPNYHNALNTSMALTTQGGTSAIDWTKNGLTTKAAQTTGWDGGANIKYWQIELNTTNYNSLKLYSKQTAGGANPGPRDWKAQYKVGSTGTWTDIPGTTLINANDWTSAVINNVSIPSACNNQASVFIRWLMTSDTSIAPPALVLSNGTTKIDDIYILGSVITSVDEIQALDFNVYPNPSNGVFTITSNSPVAELNIYNIQGRQVYCNPYPGMQQIIDLSAFEKGMYFIRYRINKDDKFNVEKLLIK